MQNVFIISGEAVWIENIISATKLPFGDGYHI